MTTIGADDLEYDSDPEEAKPSLAMRRREASDDEEGEGSGEKPRPDRRVPIQSEESDDQGGAAEYDEEEDEEEDEELVLEDEEEAEIEEEVDGSVSVVAAAKEVGDGDGLPPEETDEVEGEEGKKENEPFAVPTAGAFYMHDDRFRDSSGARHRRAQGGKKLWESRDDKKWGHDKYEEISTTDRRFQEGRSSRGNFRGRGRGRGGERGSGRGSRPKANNNSTADNSNPIQGTRSARGKGQRKYEPAMKNNVHQPSMQYKQSGKSNEKPSNANSARAFTPMTNSEFESAPARTNAFASSLNSASPPFYPSGSSTNEINFTQKRVGHFGNANKNFRSSSGDGAPQRGKNTVNSIGMDKLNIRDSTNPAAGKALSNMHNSSSGATNATQSRVHGRNGIPPQMAYQPATHNQNTRGSLSAHPRAFQRGHSQGQGQASVQPHSQQLGHRPGSGSQASPPQTALSINSFESGDVDLPSEASKSKTAIVAKGKGVVQGSGRGSVMYGGAQVIGTTGNMPGAHGDQNFPGAPTFLPVMQFGGQHPGGMGVPAVGMAFPGYVGQPQGRGNTEMTWLPVLAGAAGAYCPPYIPVDGAYHARPSGQSSSGSVSSKENNTTKADSEWKSSQKPEIVNDEFGQRQNKPRRYSEMSFGQ